jgi:hypothetical protein
MGLQIIPNSVGGISTSSIASGPLASLFTNNNQVQNLIFPSDLASNPSMGHAVLIQAYDYTTTVGNTLGNIGGTISNLIENPSAEEFANAIKPITESISAAVNNPSIESLSNALNSTGLGTVATAANYSPQKKGSPLASVSLFLPENLTVNYNSTYTDISITEELGVVGFAGNLLSDASKMGLSKAITPYVTTAAATGLNKVSSLLGGTGQIGSLAAQGAGVFVNPQMQLLYKGVGLRTFQLEFLMTPKTAAEAKTVQNICDTLTFYSLPGIAGAQRGGSGQFLTPPQIFSVQFKFLGQDGVVGSISNVIKSALNNSGLGFLTQGTTSSISNANDAKLFKVNDCVLEDVTVDYAPNGWSAYKDGYPVQTRLTLQFKETTMITKDQFRGSQIEANYNTQQQLNSTLSPKESVG